MASGHLGSQHKSLTWCLNPLHTDFFSKQTEKKYCIFCYISSLRCCRLLKFSNHGLDQGVLYNIEGFTLKVLNYFEKFFAFYIIKNIYTWFYMAHKMHAFKTTQLDQIIYWIKNCSRFFYFCSCYKMVISVHKHDMIMNYDLCFQMSMIMFYIIKHSSKLKQSQKSKSTSMGKRTWGLS